jgi:hypothetical protein
LRTVLLEVVTRMNKRSGMREEMRRVVLLCLLAMLFPATSRAEQQERSNAVVVSPLPLLFVIGSAEYQVGLGRGTVVIHGSVYPGIEYGDVGWKGLQGSVGYRFILSGPQKGDPLEGCYIAPILYVGLANRMVLGSTSGTIRSFGLGFDVGYQFVSNRGFTLNLNTGLRNQTFAWGTADVLDFPPLASESRSKGWWPGVGVGIGYAF